MEMPNNDGRLRELKRVRQQWNILPDNADTAMTAVAPGCAIIDSGTTAGVVSLNAADNIQKH